MVYKLFERTGYYPTLFDKYEENTTRFCRDFIRKDMVVFDVGANVGYYTLLFAELAKEVHSFEPTDHIETLKNNIIKNDIKNVILNNIAVGETDGETEARIIKNWPTKEIEEFKRNFITLDTYAGLNRYYLDNQSPIDTYTSELKRVDLIKIDVDSWDFEVLKGSIKLMKEFKPVILIELNVEALSYRNHTIEEVLEWVKKHGYYVKEILDTEMYLLMYNNKSNDV
jgi:FkbM family methyltransferase